MRKNNEMRKENNTAANFTEYNRSSEHEHRSNKLLLGVLIPIILVVALAAAAIVDQTFRLSQREHSANCPFCAALSAVYNGTVDHHTGLMGE